MRHPDARTTARKRLPKSLTAAVAGAAAAAIALPSAISYADPVPPPPAPAPAPKRAFHAITAAYAASILSGLSGYDL
nr:APA family fibronectin-binding glycoprotein [Mycolicibacterium llatzerense]